MAGSATLIAKCCLVWFGIAIAAVANGMFRELVLRPKLGERYAHLLSTLILSGVVLLASFATTAWIGVQSLNSAWAIGVGWLIATLAFEFLAGHYAFGNPWAKILHDYNAAKARVWILVPSCILFGPPLAFRGIEARWHLPYAASLIVAVGTLTLAFARPRAARWLLAAMFGYAGIYNCWLGLTHPTEYLNFADLVLIGWYRDTILGAFAAQAGPFIVAIAIGQLACSAAYAVGGKWLAPGAIGICLFLMAIAPFGVGSAFPFSMIVSLAAVIVSASLQPASAN